MKPEDILKMVKEGSIEVIEGLGALESMGKNLAVAGRALEEVSKDARKLTIVVEKLSKKIHK